MKNFSTKKRLLASVAPALAVFAALFSSACDRVEQAELSPADPISMVDPATDLSAERRKNALRVASHVDPGP